MYIRRPAVAGRFYTADPVKLRNEIDSYLTDADIAIDTTQDVLGVISPHAGYIYSGPIAAYSYKILKQRDYDTVIVLAPSHRYRFEEASVIPSGEYQTPLGDMEIDSDFGKVLLNSTNFTYLKEAHEIEHSLEVQVPFLQTVLSNVTIVPILIGTHESSRLQSIAQNIVEAVKESQKKMLIVISTDLSHFYSYEKAKQLDKKFYQAVETLDPFEIEKSISDGTSEACGAAAVVTGFHVLKHLGANECRVLNYRNSGDTAGSKAEVVGYLSAAIL